MDIAVKRDAPVDIPVGEPNPTSPLPRMRRVWLIAMRDFVGYVKTWGFWLSFLFPVIFAVGGFLYAQSDIDLSPPKFETILDQTNYHGEKLIEFEQREYERRRELAVSALGMLLPKSEQEAFEAFVEDNGADAGIEELRRRNAAGADQVDLPERSLFLVDPPANTLADLRPYLDGDKTVSFGEKTVPLNGVIVIKGTQDAPITEYWTRNFNNAPAERLLNRYLRDLAETRFFAQTDLTKADYDEALKDRVRVAVFDPTKASEDGGEDQAVSMWDRAPYIVGAALGIFLLMTIFAGSLALLTSMIEEKMNKLLEMMLASAKFSEIMLGKMLGAAMLTLASLAPYFLVGIAAVIGFLFFGNAEQVEAIREAFPLSTIIISIVYLVLGYMLYATVLISLGALAQSMQDAQTLSLPIIMLMFAGMLTIQFGFLAPDSPPIVFASIFPLTSPFAMMIRLASDPPLWQILLSLALLLASVVGVMWLCARIFRFGVLSGGGVGVIKNWFKRTILRRAA